MAESNLTRKQREAMATEVSHKAGSRIERFDWASATVADDVVQLHKDLAPYASLIQQLRGSEPVDDCELLCSCAVEVRDECAGDISLELRTLEQLHAGEWDYTEPDTPKERARIERQTRLIIADDRERLSTAEAVLHALDDHSSAAA